MVRPERGKRREQMAATDRTRRKDGWYSAPRRVIDITRNGFRGCNFRHDIKQPMRSSHSIEATYADKLGSRCVLFLTARCDQHHNIPEPFLA